LHIYTATGLKLNTRYRLKDGGIMKRPIIPIALSLICGILFSYYITSFFLIIISILAFTFLVIMVVLAKKRYLIPCVLILIFYITGCLQFKYLHNVSITRYSEYYGKKVTISGCIYSLPEIKNTTVNYVLKTDKIKLEGKTNNVKGKIIITQRADDKSALLTYGERVTVEGELTEPKGATNPGGFDYKRYLAGKGIYASMFINKYSISIESKNGGNPFVKAGIFIRMKIVDIINRTLPEQQAGLLNGMLIGYRDGLTDEVEKAFSDSGLVHIMAVSGANIAFIILPFVFIFKKLKIKPVLAHSLTIAVVIVFVFITGFSPSVFRAAIMSITILVGRILRRETDTAAAIAFSAIVLLLMNPYNIFDVGFQLSFSATISLVLFCRNINKIFERIHIPKYIREALAVTVAAQVGVIPITAYHYNNICLISPLSNLLAAPTLELITILGSGMALTGFISINIAKIIGLVNCTLLSALLYITKTTAAIPYAVIKVITPPLPLIILYYCIVLYLLWYAPGKNIKIRSKFKLKYAIVSVFAVTVVITVTVLIPNKMEVVFIDVGQGDSILIKTAGGRKVLIDGGGKESFVKNGESNGKVSSESLKSYSTDIGEKVVAPLLLDKRVRKLDIVIGTHEHADHIQGLEYILENFKVSRFIYPYTEKDGGFKDILDICRKKGIKTSMCALGDVIKIDKYTFMQVLNPERPADAESAVVNASNDNAAGNNLSLVLKLEYKNTSILFTGDAEKEVEKRMLVDKLDLEADVLKLGHHGSDTSTTEDFLKNVSPKAAVICVGKNNYGHPSESVLESVDKYNIKLFRTDLNGAVILKSDGDKLWIKGTVR